MIATMKRPMYREHLIDLERRLALEDDPAKRLRLAHRLKYEIDELEAAEMKTITPRQAYSANYWKARAARLRQARDFYRSQAAHDHLMQVAAGYDSLAELAYRIQENAGQASAWPGRRMAIPNQQVEVDAWTTASQLPLR
jgi:hypothetical protein